MKTKIKILVILLGIIISSVLFTKQAFAQQENVSFQVFYDELSPYGQWADHPNYGYIWIPDVDLDFVPYSTNGYWALSDYGWTWVSDYDWGWAPFHYGRWDYDDDYGWFWLPDNQWGPAWVTWRRANGYYGWSPMRPGISISLSFGRSYNRDRDHWMFVRDRDLQRRNLSRYYVSGDNHDRIIRNSTVINRTYIDRNRRATYISGPDRWDVQRVIGKRVTPISIRDNSRPGQNVNDGQLHIYRPQIKNSTDRNNRPVPKQYTRPGNVRQPGERNSESQPRNVNRQTTQPQRQTTQPQRQSPPPTQIKRELQHREPQKVSPPENTKRNSETTQTTQTRRTKSERDKKTEEKKERKD